MAKPTITSDLTRQVMSNQLPEGYVICINDYPVEISFLGAEGARKRAAELQARLNLEDGASDGIGIQRFAHHHNVPVLGVKPQPNRVVIEVTGAVLSVRAERPEDVVLIVANPGGPMAFPRQTAFGGKHGRPIGKLNTVKEEEELEHQYQEETGRCYFCHRPLLECVCE